MPVSTSRNYCFTAYSEVKYDEEQVQYIIIGKETCPTTNKIHWQGYVEFYSPKSLRAAKLILQDDTIHFEKRMGTQDQAIDYCKKEDKTPHEFGSKARQGKRSDLAEAFDEYKSVTEFIEKKPALFSKYHNGIRAVYNHRLQMSVPLLRPIIVEVYWGLSNTGKTYKAITENEDHYILAHSGPQIWWDGYHGQKTLIIDEFYGWINYDFFLRILDKYQVQLQIKGGHTYAAWNKVIITSNQRPEHWYKDDPKVVCLDSMMRRLTLVKEFDRVPEISNGVKRLSLEDTPPHKKQKPNTPVINIPTDFVINTQTHD